MPRAVSTAEAKNKLPALIAWVREHEDAVVVENRGKPSAVLVSYTEYEAMQGLKERQRRQEAVEQLRRLRDQVSARNQDLTDEQVESIAEQTSRDVMQGLIDKGKVRFQQ